MGGQTHPKPKMWMLDCKDYVKEFNDDSLFERGRLRHLMPRPTSSCKAGPPRPFLASSFCSSISRTNAFSWNHQLSKDQDSIKEPLVSSRWNPTPEQLKALQEMYQRGVRTPSAEEIQLIAAKLRHFGRIEGKNVFYWFQNHKARERQKRRRQPDSFLDKKTQDIESLEAKETSLGWKYLDAEQNKKFVTTSNCITLAPKGSAASMHETAVTESRANGWTHLDEKQQRQTSQGRAAKGEAFLMALSCMTPPYNQLNSNINASSKSEETSGRAEQKQSAALSFKIFSANQDEEDLIKLQNGRRENQVLQLFPLREHDPTTFRTSKIDEEEVTTTLNANVAPNHFYEFL